MQSLNAFKTAEDPSLLLDKNILSTSIIFIALVITSSQRTWKNWVLVLKFFWSIEDYEIQYFQIINSSIMTYQLSGNSQFSKSMAVSVATVFKNCWHCIALSFSRKLFNGSTNTFNIAFFSDNDLSNVLMSFLNMTKVNISPWFGISHANSSTALFNFLNNINL